jgi:hypothetical protein
VSPGASSPSTARSGRDRYTGDAHLGIEVWDAEAGRKRTTWQGFIPNLQLRPVHPWDFGAVVLSPRGSVAFTVDDVVDDVVRVHRVTLDGRHRVLDDSPDVAARSLRRDGTRVRWRRGGVARSASLR